MFRPTKIISTFISWEPKGFSPQCHPPKKCGPKKAKLMALFLGGVAFEGSYPLGSQDIKMAFYHLQGWHPQPWESEVISCGHQCPEVRGPPTSLPCIASHPFNFFKLRASPNDGNPIAILGDIHTWTLERKQIPQVPLAQLSFFPWISTAKLFTKILVKHQSLNCSS